jgi:hypothetical protein
MGWNRHPDTITMEMVSRAAAEKAGGTASLDYLKYYRGEYELAAFGEEGTFEYIRELDQFIADWEAGKRPDVSTLSVPMMGLASTRLPSDKTLLQRIMQKVMSATWSARRMAGDMADKASD